MGSAIKRTPLGERGRNGTNLFGEERAGERIPAPDLDEGRAVILPQYTGWCENHA
jgi:hypothetical protein